MNIILDNWYVIILILAVITLAVLYVRKFYGMPTEEQVKKIKEWLLYAVIEAEKEFGKSTGQIKLRYVYSKFCAYFPRLVAIVPFDLFEKMVDSALEQMRHLIETNVAIKTYVEGENKE